ncbi:hypothetical protein MIR68_009022 [Amoeboaphelidium protococcarum]|nr:hypothetical protein MIR68_009022 [Amoeboaphelidium protococcarum]
MDAKAIANEFVKYYYSTFDASRANLAPLYKSQSMLTFEGQEFQGSEKIVEKLSSLPFQKVAHKVTTVDVQPGNTSGNSILVAVTGQLLVDNESNPQFFSQVFQLNNDGSGNWFVFNDVFRLNYA